jgi:hypothetical protein
LRIALVLHIANVAADDPDDGVFPEYIPDVSEDTMLSAITLVRWYQNEAARILRKANRSAVVAADKEAIAIMKLIQNQGGTTTVNKIAQYVSAFSGRGGSERATSKLATMVQNGLLLGSVQKASNGRQVKVYSLALPDTADTDAIEGVASNMDRIGSIDTPSTRGCRQSWAIVTRRNTGTCCRALPELGRQGK